MNKLEPRIKLYLQLGVFAVVWVLLLIFSRTTSLLDWVNVVKKFPQAVMVYAFLGVAFTKWGWRWRIFKGWLVKIPDLHGTWRGSLISTWVDPSTDEKLPPIPAVLVIKQTFSRIDCSLHTKESSSYSTAAEINEDQSGSLYLNYNYTNRPKASIRERSEIHDGASILKIIQAPQRSLEGEYWTSRKTTGEMKFEFQSKVLAEKFTDATNNV